MKRTMMYPTALAAALLLAAPSQVSASDRASAPDAGATAAASHSAVRATPAAKAGRWIQLSSSPGVSLINEPNALRLPTGGVQVIWKQDDGPSTSSIRTRIVKESGHVGSPISTVVKNWASVATDPRIIRHGTKRLVAFGGIRSTNAGETLRGEMAYATSGNGRSWSLGPGSLTQTTYTSAYGTAAVDDRGTPIVGTIGTSTNVVTLHRGIDPSRPASAPDWTTKSGTFGTYAYYVGLAQDAKTNQVWVAWYSNASEAQHNGILVERVYPRPPAKVFKAPGSSVRDNSTDPGQNVAIAASTRGGIYVAYKVGYPTANHVRIWEVGTRHTLTVATKGAQDVMLASGPGGRLWLAWYSTTQHRIKVARTDAGVNRVGAIRSITPPGDRYSSVWKVTGSGATGPLHLVTNAQPGGKNAQIWYQKVAPGLTLVAKPHTLNHGVVVAKVTDAGNAVGNAKVTFRGATKRTNGKGIAKFRVPASVHSGRYGMRATKPGYFPAIASVKVT